MFCINPVDVKNVMKKIAEKGNKFQCEIFIFSYPGTEVVKLFSLFILNSAAHEIYPAHKC